MDLSKSPESGASRARELLISMDATCCEAPFERLAQLEQLIGLAKNLGGPLPLPGLQGIAIAARK
jgi:hypothetical protein